MSCACRTRENGGTGLVPVAAGEYQVITLETADASGAVSRRRVELGRLWRELTVVEIPDSALSSPLYLHLGDSDPGIRLLHRGQRIRVPQSVGGALTSQPQLYWSADEADAYASDVELVASDVVELEVDPPGPTTGDVLSGTISSTGQTSLGPAAAGSVSRWAIHIDVDGSFNGTVNFLGRVHPADGELVSVHYISLTSGDVATADLTDDAIVLVDATGLGDLVIDATVSAGSFTYYARPVRG